MFKLCRSSVAFVVVVVVGGGGGGGGGWLALDSVFHPDVFPPACIKRYNAIAAPRFCVQKQGSSGLKGQELAWRKCTDIDATRVIKLQIALQDLLDGVCRYLCYPQNISQHSLSCACDL